MIQCILALLGLIFWIWAGAIIGLWIIFIGGTILMIPVMLFEGIAKLLEATYRRVFHGRAY